MPKNAIEFERMQDEARREVDRITRDEKSSFSEYIGNQLDARDMPSPSGIGIAADVYEIGRSFSYKVFWRVEFDEELTEEQRRELDLIPPRTEYPIKYISVIDQDVILEKR